MIKKCQAELSLALVQIVGSVHEAFAMAHFPFSAIVGQDEMTLAMILTALDPGLGGVLVFGDRGPGKSTAVRGLAAPLPDACFSRLLEDGGEDRCHLVHALSILNDENNLKRLYEHTSHLYYDSFLKSFKNCRAEINKIRNNKKQQHSKNRTCHFKLAKQYYHITYNKHT